MFDSHSEVIDEALPAGGSLQEVVDPALDVAAAEQRSADAVDGDARVQADRRAREIGAHHYRGRLSHFAAARRLLRALGSGGRGDGKRRIVGVGGVLG